MDWKKRRTLGDSKIRRVGIVGGTHGNESNGVQLAKHFLRNHDEVKRTTFEVEVLLANRGAIEQNTRYVEEDLNRCYYLNELVDDTKASATVERKRAREIDAVLGPKSSDEPRCDFILDLHNTTAATGIALMMAPGDDFAHELASHLMKLDRDVRVVNWNKVDDWAVCPSIGRSGMTFEVGPCPWGCVVPDLFAQSRKLVLALLDYIDNRNILLEKGIPLKKEVSMPVFKSIGISIDYPRDASGELTGMIHPDLQGQDFKELREGDNLFMTFGGEVLPFRRVEHKVPDEHGTIYALFVNEAAYYEKKIALMLTARVEETFWKVAPAETST